MQVRLLGPIDILVNNEPLQVNGQRRKAVLAVLAMQRGEVVSTTQLMDLVWGDTPPPTALNALQSHVSYLRGLMGARTAILTRPPGYVLELPGDGTDVQLAERLLREGTRSADPVDAARQLQRALALWRGEPLAELADLPWLAGRVERLGLLRLQLRQALSEARLAAGEHAQLVGELEQMVTDCPLDERVHGQLMLALYRCGRQADSLAAYGRLRRALDEDLGIEPSQFLRDLQTAILNQDPALASALPGSLTGTQAAQAAQAAGPPGQPALPIPAQLPAAVPSFTGRGAELANLDAIARSATLITGHVPGTATLVAVSGTAGVGKTALAVHWAHSAAARFPDGQLYVNLRGFDPAGAALDPGQALHGFLDALDVPSAQIPDDVAPASALFRSLVADKQILIVLDNARDAEQVRPLLPGSPGCLTVVTSRDQLTGLVATEGAVPLALDLLSAADARQLLIKRLGVGRVAAEPVAVDRITGACARLPLALAIAAARAAARPAFPLAAIAAELGESTSALDPFEGGDRATDVRAVFSWSYRALSDPAAAMFRLLGLHPGPDIAVAAAASLVEVPLRQARALLIELTRAHLLTEHVPGRYAFHDLLRAYACELVRAEDDQAAQDTAIDRLVTHYLHTAHHAAMLMEPFHCPITMGPPPSGVIVGQPATAEEALAWFSGEQAALVAAVRLTARIGSSTSAWQLAWISSTFFLRLGLWPEQARVCQEALSAARRAGDQTGEAQCLQRLAIGYAKSGRTALGKPLLIEAMRLFEVIGDLPSQAMTCRALSWIADRQELPAEMLSYAQRCYELWVRADHPAGQALALQDIGHAHAQLGNYDLAIANCERALVAMRQAGEPAWEGAVWDSLGYTHHQRGDYRQAIACYERAADLSQRLGDRFNEADTHNNIGDVHSSAGNFVAARSAWTQALRIFDQIEHPDRDRVRAKLQAPVQQTA
jgi:DNA-binding SARP family transcriptional activator/tetratricopeptide (TPR) repeat protein